MHLLLEIRDMSALEVSYFMELRYTNRYLLIY